MQRKWISVTIKTEKQAHDMVELFKAAPPTVAAFDTETTGLNIVQDIPFLFQFGWLSDTEPIGYTFAVDLELTPELAHRVITWWNNAVATINCYLGQNVKYDLHMLANIGHTYTTENLSDTMFYIRFAHDAIPERAGGVPLALKKYASLYIDRTAAHHEHLLKAEQKSMAHAYNLLLLRRLGPSWTLGKLNAFFKDKVKDVTDLPEEAQARYNAWLELDVPKSIRRHVVGTVKSENIPYNLLNREVVTRYAHQDIVLTLSIYDKLKPIVDTRKNNKAIKLENALIIPLFEMERVGFKINRTYLFAARDKMKQYIYRRRKDLEEAAGQHLTVNQHAVIKTILYENYGIEMQSTSDEALSRVCSDLQHESPGHPAVAFIKTIQELRTLEKWYSVYLMRFVHMVTDDDKLYTSINQVGAVSGRVTSDFQQFPKDAIKTIDGEVLFQPRQMIEVSGGDYDAIVYLDYSQIELRLQAMYTILVGHPDTNLCRAYMPYKCTNDKGELFNPTNAKHITTWNKTWYDETGAQWTPLDVHGATTKIAFGVTEDDPEYKRLRYEGKRVNFAKNYGAKFGRIKQMFPDYTDEQIAQIDGAYYAAFPGVKQYHDYCYKLADISSHATNLFGVKYYNVSGHNLINMLIQGSGAYFLKWKIRQIYDYCKQHGIKSRFQMNIHDELSWEKHKDDSIDVFFEFQKIMEQWDDTLVPIVADMEITYTTWAEKKEVEHGC